MALLCEKSPGARISVLRRVGKTSRFLTSGSRQLRGSGCLDGRIPRFIFCVATENTQLRLPETFASIVVPSCGHFLSSLEIHSLLFTGREIRIELKIKLNERYRDKGLNLRRIKRLR